MVTHDTALKCYANRVVKVQDGKIVKVEDIDLEVRRVAIQSLKEQIQHSEKYDLADKVLQTKVPKDLSRKDEENLLIKEEAKVNQPQNITNKSTIITEKRTPKDHPALSFALKLPNSTYKF